MALAVAEGQSSSGVGTIPLIVDLDAHVVEPPDVWSSRLPARLREVGPHIEYMPGGVPVLKGSSYVESPGRRDLTWRGGATKTTGRPSSGPSRRRDLQPTRSNSAA